MSNNTPYSELNNNGEAGFHLEAVGRCPHCSIASPNLERVWSDGWRALGQTNWAAYRCNSCRSVVVAHLVLLDKRRLEALGLWPGAKSAHEDIPDPARTYLQQAYDTLHAPDAAALMAGSAVDAMLKAHELVEGNLYSRIDKALERNILTKGMAEWAHSVRLGSNRPRHADKEKPHVSPEEAKQSVEFAEALGSFLFVLTAKIDRGIQAAEAAGKGAAEKVNDMKP